MLLNLFPPDLISTTVDDLKTLYNYSQIKPKTNTEPDPLENNSVESVKISTLENKVCGAAYRVFSVGIAVAGVILGLYLIAPILTFNFCLAVSISVGLFIAGHDVFCMAQNRENEKNVREMPPIEGRETYFKMSRDSEIIDDSRSAELIDKLLENTFLPNVWKNILLKA